MDAAAIIYQKDGEVAMWEERGTMFHAMADDRAAEMLGLLGRKDAPQFSC